MENIPTDLLRTFVLVTDLRSFTRAAKAQGMTQPAVSAQIRRLQSLLKVELFDKSAPGVSLSPIGELVINSARRMLSVNDHIVKIASPNPTLQAVRLGVPGDFMGAQLARMLKTSRQRWPNLRFTVEGGGQRRLLQYLKRDEIDLVLALVAYEPAGEARHFWKESLVWVRGNGLELDPGVPVPLVSYKDVCINHRVAVAALDQAGRAAELVFRAANAEALRSAVAAGLGIMAVPRSRVPADLEIWDKAPLPPLPPLYCGIFVRDGSEGGILDQLADQLVEALRQPAAAPKAKVFTLPRTASPQGPRTSTGI